MRHTVQHILHSKHLIRYYPLLQGRNIQPGTTVLKSADGGELSAVRDQLFIRLQSADHEAFVTKFDTQARNGVIHNIDTVLII